MEKDFNDILAKPLYGLSDDEYATIKGSATHFPDGIASKLWGQVMVRAIAEAEHREGRIKAIDLTEDCYRELDRVFPQMFDEKSELLKNACMLCLKENDQETAHKKMESYLYNALAQVHYQAVNEKMPYYSFRSFSEYSLKDIEDETISVAHPREFNDPLDTILVYWLNETIKNTKDDWNLRFRLMMKKVAEHIKIRCLIAGRKDDGSDMSVEELNVLMWSHYADSHKGFCVRYEFEGGLFDTTIHPKKDKLLFVDKIRYSETIDIGDEPSIRMALLEKSNFWKYEKEMRLVSFDCSGDDEDFPTIMCKGMAKAIYLGAKCTDANRRLMEKAIGDKNIPLYQMSVDEKKLTRFKKTLIG
jgi:hypothetical protein